MQDEIRKAIEETARAVVISLETAGYINSNKTAYQKTEWLLKNYNALKTAYSYDGTAILFISKLENALKEISNDCYCEIISLYYFENKTNEELAEIYNISVRSVRRNKTRLINILKAYLFADTCIKELILG